MKTIRLDASTWQSPGDFYSALLPALGAPSWQGTNLDALYDSLSGGINELEPPFSVEIGSSRRLSSELLALIDDVRTLFEDARREFGVDVSILLV